MRDGSICKRSTDHFQARPDWQLAIVTERPNRERIIVIRGGESAQKCLPDFACGSGHKYALAIITHDYCLR
jgi:hypothetical protein